MFVLKKTYEALQLEWAKFKHQCEILSIKIANLTSELDSVYETLRILENENNNKLKYFDYLEKEKKLGNLGNVLSYKDFVHNFIVVPKKVIPPVYKNSDVLPFTNYTSPSSSVGYIDFTLEKSGNYIHLEQITNNVSECKEDKTKNSRVDIVYTDYETKCKIEDTNSYPSYSNSNDDSSCTSSSSYSSSD
mgnify:CR=1 FL=1